MSNNDEIIFQDLQLSDDGSDPLSVNSGISDDSGIEDWSDDMTIQVEPQIPLDEKQDLPMQVADQQNIQKTPKVPVENSCENIFPGPLSADVSISGSVAVKKDVQDDNGIPGVCGLYNLGNTCFMNSALQCLFATSVIKDILTSNIENDQQDDASVIYLFMEKLQEVLKKTSSGTFSIIYPDSLHSSISRLHPGFGDYKQHDSQEFISFILNSFHDFLNNSCGQKKEGNKTILELSLTGEVSKRLKMDHSVSVESEMDAGVECEEEMLSMGACAWRDYTQKNHSVIVDRFYGQFQSVITCEKCAFVSTTHEPFMFLSLPIPYAMEKQIAVTWVPATKMITPPGVLAVRRYLVTVSKNGIVEELKKTFLVALKKDDPDVNMNNVVFAEVKNSANVKIMDDKTQLKYLSIASVVYALEVISVSNQVEQDSPGSEAVTMAVASTWHACNICFEEKFEEELSVHRSCNGVLCSGCLGETLKFTKNDGGDFPCPTCNCYIPESSYEPMIVNSGKRDPTEDSETDEGGEEIVNGSFGGASKWYTCSICLEEIFDEDIRSHLQCGGMMCANCLSTTAGFYEHKGFACPTCARFIVESDYEAIAKDGKQAKTLRQVLVPVLFRRRRRNDSENASRKFDLFGNPLITCLLSQVTSSEVSGFVDYLMKRLNLKNMEYDIVVTDASGLSCGLCDLMSPCSGCRVKDLENVQLKPGCCIALEFEENCTSVISTLSFYKDDESLKMLRGSDVVTLDECVQKFADVEILTEDNPWYCPQCQTNRAAAKIMTVTRWPEILIVHLKRFHFEGTQGSKISCPIDFPLSDLNVEILTCPDTDSVKTPIVYDLYGCINHTGSLFGGHYTAFTKVSNTTTMESNAGSPPEWYYFNDETYTKRSPPEDADYQTEAYVLFYQLKATREMEPIS